MAWRARSCTCSGLSSCPSTQSSRFRNEESQLEPEMELAEYRRIIASSIRRSGIDPAVNIGHHGVVGHSNQS